MRCLYFLFVKLILFTLLLCVLMPVHMCMYVLVCSTTACRGLSTASGSFSSPSIVGSGYGTQVVKLVREVLYQWSSLAGPMR